MCGVVVVWAEVEGDARGLAFPSWAGIVVGDEVVLALPVAGPLPVSGPLPGGVMCVVGEFRCTCRLVSELEDPDGDCRTSGGLGVVG